MFDYEAFECHANELMNTPRWECFSSPGISENDLDKESVKIFLSLVKKNKANKLAMKR